MNIIKVNRPKTSEAIGFPKPIEVPEGSDAFYCLSAMIKLWEKDIQVLNILKKYYKLDGWSNGGTIEFWKMSNEELTVVNEFFNAKKEG